LSDEYVRRALREERSPVELCFFGGSFARLKPESLTRFLETVRDAPVGSMVTFSSYPGDFGGERGILAVEILKKYPIGTIELGIPSLDPKVLKICGRDDNPAEIKRSVEFLRGEGFHLGVQAMIGLPGQTAESALRGVASLGSMMFGAKWDFRLYPCLVLRGTELENMYKRGEYFPLDIEEASRQGGRLLLEAEKFGFNVIRVGLHDSRQLKNSVSAGPYHPAFGELAISEKRALSLSSQNPNGPWKIERPALSQLTGHSGRGLRRLAELSGVSEREARNRLVVSPAIHRGNFKTP
jgi:histone acetyltransferase (RNA polymerase elongator complex component)